MPNHIKNKLKITGEVESISQLIETYSTYHKARINLDYEGKYICRKKNSEGHSVGWYDPHTGIFSQLKIEDRNFLPKDWEIEISDSYYQFPDFNKILPQPKNIFRGDLSSKDREECIKKGIPNWYDWNRENWGTKWNSYACEKQALNVYTFETAWSPVCDLIEKMASKYPMLTIIYTHASEDSGFVVGQYIYSQNKVQEKYIEQGSTEAMEIYFELWGGKEEFELIDGIYEYKEEL